MDFENYKVFYWTDKALRKKYSEETLSKYYKIIAFLYQNGFSLNCPDEEIEDELSFWNFFESESDFEDLLKSYGKARRELAVGTKIISEEFYDILKETTFTRQTSDIPAVIKTMAETNWERMNSILERISDVFSSNDFEISEAVRKIQSVNDIKSKIDFLSIKLNEGKQVLSWLKFCELVNVIYSTYIQLTKIKKEQHKITLASNINDELYGGIGGYDPRTKQIKCIVGSAVYDVKSAYAQKPDSIKIRTLASSILKDTKSGGDEYVDWLEKWYDKKETDNDKAKRIVINCLLNGILTILCIKHNLSNLVDEKNSKRADKIKEELLAVIKFAGIPKDYLL